MRRFTTRSPHGGAPAARRLVVAVGLSAGAVLTAIVVPSGALAGLTGQGEPDAYKKAYVANAKNTQAAAQGSDTIYLPDGSHVHPGGLADGRAQPQRPGDQELRLAQRHGDRRPDGRPDHARPGTAVGRGRGSAARAERTEAVQRAGQPGRTRPHRPTATTCSTPATGCSPRAPVAG